MKKFLLPEGGRFFKANLHSHSNLSDGKLSPEELKKIYKEHGYSVFAFTDHDIMIPHSELDDDEFITLNGVEYGINGPLKAWPQMQVCHVCFIALDPDNIVQPCYNPEYLFGNAPKHADEVIYDESEPFYIREYSGEGISDLIKRCREKGFFATYNHPAWSRERYPEYMSYKGMDAMEIFNFGTYVEGYDEYNAKVYDDKLRNGERLFVIATDDNHNHGAPGTCSWDSFGGFTMIKAEKLEYKAITDALVKGNFYASQGPEIKELWYEEGKIHIDCSPAERIVCTSSQRISRRKCAESRVPVTSAEFSVHPDDVYIRITVTDAAGRHADTNAYFIDELNKD